MNQQVTKFIKKHQLLNPGSTVLVGVSGGPDSMALLHFLAQARETWNLKLIVLSADHQLRGEESIADQRYIKHMCEQWNIQFIGAALNVPKYKQAHKLGTQAAARAMRYQFFQEQMEAENADYLALGHHGDDQAETMLMALLRTASSSSFAGIPLKRPFATGAIIRPFLCLTKAEIEAYCGEHGIEPRIDPSNQETVYTRNFIRKELLPVIREKNPNIHTTLQQLSHTLKEDEQFLRREAEKVWEKTVTLNDEEQSAEMDIDVFCGHPPALQRRVYHLLLDYLYGRLPKDLSYIHEEQFFALLESEKSNVQLDFPAQLKLEKTYRKLQFSFLQASQADPSFHHTLEVPGRVELPDGSLVTAEYRIQTDGAGPHQYVLGMEQVGLPLHIRTRKPGDRMSWKGLKGRKKLKDLFIDEKISPKERDNWPVVTDNNGEILWLPGLKKGEPENKVKPSSYIQITYEKSDVQEENHAKRH
ncbi:tRNA lysidine(34) synthetase TilS [Lentibacillus sediminis]|uniref:tRNA lysidine(34) synthetase TilS n=1 Tax=Lentibacillus sediminis TaxID=1940529 RepID=UPI000C1BD4DF|nr:tRNA lysidine(34) synthetase TilS [Lentibacillus sediminis]